MSKEYIAVTSKGYTRWWASDKDFATRWTKEERDKWFEEPREVDIELRDGETFQTFMCKAIVCRNPKKLQDADILWVYPDEGTPYVKEKWAVKILKKYEEEIFMKKIQLEEKLTKRKDVISSLIARKRGG